MINHFRKHMKRPLVGIGHSMGGNNLVNLAIIHPSLFTSLILIDPVIQRLPSAGGNFEPAKSSARRRDLWPNRRAATAKLKSSPFYQKWDSRVLDRWVEYGFRETPTYLYPDIVSASTTPPVITADPSTATISPSKDERQVTLTTTKHQEVLSFYRYNPATPEYPDPDTKPNPLTHPDVDPSSIPNSPFYQPVPISTFHKLPFVRPSVFYIFGDLAAGAFLSAPILKADKLANTGIGVGGSGGVKAGRVDSVTFDGVGHLIPMEVVGRTADACVDWLVPELARWKKIEDEELREWMAVPKRERAMLSQEYLTEMSKDRSGKGKKEAKL